MHGIHALCVTLIVFHIFIRIMFTGKSFSTTTMTGDDCKLQLNLQAIQNGQDKRTSLMVRNIPNKYTQQMMLNELRENGYDSQKIDFFYLPIDFKNKCNRGYAFVNFVDYLDIVPFWEHYHGRHWRMFNSDKICDVSCSYFCFFIL